MLSAVLKQTAIVFSQAGLGVALFAVFVAMMATALLSIANEAPL